MTQPSSQTLSSSGGIAQEAATTGALVANPALVELNMTHEAPIIAQTLSRSAMRRRRRRRSAMAQAPPAVEASSGPWEPSAEAEAAGAREVARSLVGQFRAGGQARTTAIARLPQLTFADRLSSRAAQLALSVLSAADASELASGLHGHIREAASTMYANRVVQKLLEVLPPSGSSFVASELLGAGDETARNRFGCRVLCSLLQNGFPNEQLASALVDEVLRDAEVLCQHRFGSRVMWHILRFGLPGHRHMVVRALHADTAANAASKHGSSLVEAALNFASPLDKHVIANDVLEHGGTLLSLSGDRFGCRVVMRILKMPGFSVNAAAILRPVAARLSSGTEFSKRVLAMMDAIT